MNSCIKLMAFLITLTSCRPGQLTPVEQSSDVYGASLGNFKLTNPTSVCWIDEGEETRKEWVKQAIANSWSKYAEIYFTGWSSCSNLDRNELARTIRLGWKRVCNNEEDNVDCNSSVGGWANIGFSAEKIILFAPTKENLLSKYNSKLFFYYPEEIETSREILEFVSIHEFGHLLGFMHEHQRSDAESSSDCMLEASHPSLQSNYTKQTSAQDSGYEYHTAYDQNSVMNYCRGVALLPGPPSKYLSQLDINSIRALYPARYPEGEITEPPATDPDNIRQPQQPQNKICELNIQMPHSDTCTCPAGSRTNFKYSTSISSVYKICESNSNTPTTPPPTTPPPTTPPPTTPPPTTPPPTTPPPTRPPPTTPPANPNQAFIDYCNQSRSRASESTLLNPVQETYDISQPGSLFYRSLTDGDYTRIASGNVKVAGCAMWANTVYLCVKGKEQGTLTEMNGWIASWPHQSQSGFNLGSRGSYSDLLSYCKASPKID